MNPTENLWRIVKRRLEMITITTKDQLIEVKKLWYKDSKIYETCATLVNSMPQRLDELLRAKEYHTKY
jgi:hypothetical protein